MSEHSSILFKPEAFMRCLGSQNSELTGSQLFSAAAAQKLARDLSRATTNSTLGEQRIAQLSAACHSDALKTSYRDCGASWLARQRNRLCCRQDSPPTTYAPPADTT